MTKPTPFATIGLLGFGTIGAGIAEVFATSGRQVVVLDTDTDRLAAGRAAVARSLEGSGGAGPSAPDDNTAILARVAGTLDLDDLAGVDLVVEAITDDIDAKRALLGRVATVVGARTPILTSTSVLSVAAIAAALPDPTRVAGLHFIQPAPRHRTVEIVRALSTEDALIDELLALVDTLSDKDPIVVKDRPGLLVDALLIPYLNDVIQEYDDGLATAEDIDVALKLGLGYRVGPFEMLDRIGLDEHLQATEAVYAATGDDRYAAPPLLRQMVAADRLGAKNGRGFRAGQFQSDK